MYVVVYGFVLVAVDVRSCVLFCPSSTGCMQLCIVLS